MPFGSYVQLCEAIEKWLVRPDLSADIPDLVWLAECRIQQDLDLPLIETESTGSLSTVNDYISLPSDCQELKFFGVPGLTPPTGINIVPQYEWQQVAYQKSGTGTIIAGNIRGSRLYLAGAPTAADTYNLTYLAGITHMDRTTVTSNSLLLYDPNLLLYAALVESAPFVGDDERVQTWGLMYEDRRKMKKKQIFRHRSGGGPLRTRPDGITP